jgi:hypothetical protein
MRKCKFCITEIDDNAKICPNCKKDLRNFTSRHPIITFIIFIIVLWQVITVLNSVINTTSENQVNYILDNQTIQDPNWIWYIWYYTDDFWEKTDESVITNKEYIKWTFSNTATENSSLNVKFLIDNENNISIKLFEYSRNNPVKSASYNSYTLNIKDKDWNKYKFSAINNTDRLIIKKTELWPKDLYNILLKWWEVKFVITDDDFPSQYYFQINADGFNNIVKQK